MTLTELIQNSSTRKSHLQDSISNQVKNEGDEDDLDIARWECRRLEKRLAQAGYELELEDCSALDFSF